MQELSLESHSPEGRGLSGAGEVGGAARLRRISRAQRTGRGVVASGGGSAFLVAPISLVNWGASLLRGRVGRRC